MIQICGDNDFPNGIYDPEHWSAPITQMPEELAAFFKTAAIAGRRIAGVRSIGPCYNLTEEWLQNFAIAASMQQEDPEKAFPPIVQCIPEDTQLARLILVDMPVVIEFDTGDRLEVLFDRGSEVRAGLNSLPENISSPGGDNVDLNVLFSEAIGRRILGIQVGRRKDLPEDWKPPQGEDWKTQETLIAYILLQLEGGIGLAFEPFKESGRVFIMGSDRKLHNISFGALKPALDPKIFEIPDM